MLLLHLPRHGLTPQPPQPRLNICMTGGSAFANKYKQLPHAIYHVAEQASYGVWHKALWLPACCLLVMRYTRTTPRRKSGMFTFQPSLRDPSHPVTPAYVLYGRSESDAALAAARARSQM